jgi:amidase
VDAADLAFAGLVRQAELVREGTVSARELTELYLERITRLDPAIRAYRVVLAEQALDAADAADRRRGPGAPPLNGVPIAIKDDTDVAGEVTTHGSLGHGGPAERDAEVVARLRAAGAVILGKTNVPELEALGTTESLAFGATRNPWDLARIAGGSSGGSGAAVAAGLAAAAHATDGVGSIRIPAAANGVFGLKPQRDRVPMGRNWHGLAVTGALTRGVLDNAAFLDAATQGEAFRAAATRAPGPLRIACSFALPRGIFTRVDDEPRRALAQTVEQLRALGHTVEERDPVYGNVGVNVIARYLANVSEDAGAMPHPELLARWTKGLAAMGGRIPGAVVRRAHAQEAADRERLNRILADHDVLLTPTLTGRPPNLGAWLGLPAPVMLTAMVNLVAFLGLWNHTGQPAASLPVAAAADGFPVGVQLVGRPGDEATLLSLAAQLETATGWLDRRPPTAG